MEITDLVSAVVALLLVGLIVGIGAVILGTFSSTSRSANTILNESIMISNGTCTASAQNHVDSSTATYMNQSAVAISPIYFVWDNSNKYEGTCVEFTDEGELLYGNMTTGTKKLVYMRYTYGASNLASDALDDSSTGIGGFSSWIPLIVIMIAASIIIGLVVHSFVGRRE
jgi:hypothetical protein